MDNVDLGWGGNIDLHLKQAQQRFECDANAHLVRAPNIRRLVHYCDRELEKHRLRKTSPGREALDDRRDEVDILSALDNFRRALQENRPGSKLLGLTAPLTRDRYAGTVLVGDVLFTLLKLGRPNGDAFGGTRTRGNQES